MAIYKIRIHKTIYIIDTQHEKIYESEFEDNDIDMDDIEEHLYELDSYDGLSEVTFAYLLHDYYGMFKWYEITPGKGVSEVLELEDSELLFALAEPYFEPELWIVSASGYDGVANYGYFDALNMHYDDNVEEFTHEFIKNLVHKEKFEHVTDYNICLALFRDAKSKMQDTTLTVEEFEMAATMLDFLEKHGCYIPAKGIKAI